MHPTARNLYRDRHFFHAVECKPPAPAGAISVQKLKKKREKKKERRRNEIMAAPSLRYRRLRHLMMNEGTVDSPALGGGHGVG